MGNKGTKVKRLRRDARPSGETTPHDPSLLSKPAVFPSVFARRVNIRYDARTLKEESNGRTPKVFPLKDG